MVQAYDDNNAKGVLILCYIWKRICLLLQVKSESSTGSVDSKKVFSYKSWLSL